MASVYMGINENLLVSKVLHKQLDSYNIIHGDQTLLLLLMYLLKPD